ncbi:MAG: hypothetical protein O3C05_02855, partial [Proteobacteria bacterium]|nr:hypothetical protein [Pseudomonadota bacterium]
MQYIKSLLLFCFTFCFFNLSLLSNKNTYALANPSRLGESELKRHINNIDNRLEKLQKYTYNLGAAYEKQVNAEPIKQGIDFDGFNDQFSMLRRDMEKVRHEVSQLQENINSLSSEMEQRLNDLEEPMQQEKNHARTVKAIESQLSEIGVKSKAIKVKNQEDTKVNASAMKASFAKALKLAKEEKIEGAKHAFKEFIQLYNKSPIVGAAYFWLGEIATQEMQYAEAANNYLQGYKIGIKSGRAADNLYNLARSLLKLGKVDAACFVVSRIYDEFSDLN